MEENVLFQKNTPNPPQATPSTPVQNGVSPQAPPAQPVAPSQPPTSTPPPPPPPIGNRGVVGKILKIFITLLVLGIIGFIIYRFVMPIFVGNGGSKNVELTYWGLWESEETMAPIIAEFESQHPNIKVNYERKDIGKYRQTVQTRITNGDGPDLFLFHNTWIPMMQSYLSPISNEVMTPEEFKSVYYPVIQKDLVVNGAMYGVPIGFDSLSMFVNDGIFEETGASPPKTWEDFTNTVTALTVKDEEGRITSYGAGFGAYDNVMHAPDIISVLLAQNRVDLKDPAKTTQSLEEALRFYTDFVTGDDNIETAWDTSAPSSLVAFAGGNTAIYFGYSWDVFQIRQLNPELQFSIYPMPKLSQDQTIASYWVNGVSSKGKNQKEAQEFLSFLAQKETQEKLYTESSKQRLFGLPPARRDMADLVRDNPFVYPFIAQGENASSTYFVSDTFDEGLNDQMNAYLANAVRSINENTSVESAVETLISGMNQILEQYGIK